MPQTPSPKKAASTRKAPSTPKKKRPISYPVGGSSIATGDTLATANGPSIKRTAAVKKYKIKLTDLDTIKPISQLVNRVVMGAALIQIYNELDVAALAQRVRPGKPLPELGSETAPSSPFKLAKKNGLRIMRTKAIQEFKLTPAQMDQLDPISATPNGYGTITKYYNRCDVENLKLRLEQLKSASSNRLIDFDGLDHGDAAGLFEEASHR
ncbi:hypothetical protein K438DRAFT_1807425 [Mycena galopus ATCC 62051]|nr:hypothetical protein K438DRAFT_1807425 [Mycena galopus ATCC 62051]